ncbi:MAG: trypsin-like peptidase domain-containing protein [Bacillota bacterium]|nr:trypsin-like peptidase domain-containing protein [Bacillota bacterium]
MENNLNNNNQAAENGQRPGWQNPPAPSGWQNQSPQPGWQSQASRISGSSQSSGPSQSSQSSGWSPPPSAGNQRDPRPRRASRLGIVAAFLGGALLSGLAGGFLAFNLLTTGVDETRATTELPVTTEAAETTGAVETRRADTPTAVTVSAPDGTMSVREIAEKASPAVVAIYVEAVQDTFFGRQVVEGAGSGVIIASNGYILTNNHVIANSHAVNVRLADGNEYEAELVGSDSVTDLAVLKIDAEDLPYLEFGDSSELHVGDQIVAIGNPLGDLQGTVTAGYVSALNRDVETDSGTLYGVIQVDAAINSGNSGGALLNTRGELVGINVAKPVRTGVEGIAFSIPVSTAQPIAEQLIESGTVRRPMIGITGSDVPANNPYDLTPGVLVREVQPGSPAEKAGVRVRDIVTKVNGQDVASVDDVNRIKNQAEIGDKLKLTVERNGELIVIEVTLEPAVTN